MPQLRLLRFEHCDIGPLEISETSTLCLATRQKSVLATEAIYLVSSEDIYPVSTHNVDVSDVSIVAMSQCSSRRWAVWP